MIKLCQMVLLVSIFALGCGPSVEAMKKAEVDAAAKAKAEADAKEDARPKQATAILHPTLESVVTGIVTFSREGEIIRVNAEFQGLTPGMHAFHIHEVGDCSHPQAESAGGHFNPGGGQHGSPDDENSHAGDFGNVEANEKGAAKTEFVDETLTLEGENTIVSRSVIIHAGADDMATQPSGNAGARLACGVIKLN